MEESVTDLFETHFKKGLKNKKWVSPTKQKKSKSAGASNTDNVDDDSLTRAEYSYYQSLVNALVDAFLYEPGVVAEEIGLNDDNDKCMLSDEENDDRDKSDDEDLDKNTSIFGGRNSENRTSGTNDES